MPDLNYELAPKPGMTASQRKAELDGARFVAVRNLAYMIYKKPDGSALMTYQETLDNREAVKAAILNYEISLGYLQNDLGAAVAPQTQSPQQMPPQMVPQNGAMMAQQPMQPQMQFAPQMQPQAPVPAAQFAQMPMQPQAPQYAAPQQQVMPQFQPQMQQAPQQFAQQPQMMQPAAPPMEAAPVTGKKRKTAAGNAVAPPPAMSVAPPGFQPQQAAVPVMQFQPGPAVPQQQQFAPQQFAPQPQAAPQQMIQQVPVPQGVQNPMFDLGPLSGKIDELGKGLMIAANNGDQALKAVIKLSAELADVKLLNTQLLVCLHHMYLSIQGANGQQLLSAATEGKAGDLDGFRAYLQKYIGNPK